MDMDRLTELCENVGCVDPLKGAHKSMLKIASKMFV